MRNYNRLTFEERVKIETYYNLGWTLMHIADKLGRSKSTISREITRYPYSYAAESPIAGRLSIQESPLPATFG